MMCLLRLNPRSGFSVGVEKKRVFGRKATVWDSWNLWRALLPASACLEAALLASARTQRCIERCLADGRYLKAQRGSRYVPLSIAFVYAFLPFFRLRK